MTYVTAHFKAMDMTGRDIPHHLSVQRLQSSSLQVLT